MSERIAHILAKNHKSCGHPDDLIVYDTETRGQPTVDTPAIIAELKYGYAIWTRLSRGTREELEFTQADEFWDFVERRALQGRRLWVCAHNCKNFDLSVLEFEAQLTKRGWRIGGSPVLPVPDQGPLKVVATQGSKTIVLVDLANFYGPTSLERIGKSIGFLKQQFEAEADKQALLGAEVGDPLWDELRAYCKQDTEVVLAAMKTWISFLKENDLGNFAISLAGQAMQAFRHRFMTHQIFLHNNKYALKLEREAYLGAKVDCFRIGSFEGSYHVVDVNSEYPYVMKQYLYPVKLIDFIRNPSFENCRSALEVEGRAVIAKVQIDTGSDQEDPRRQAIVPVVSQGKLLYPTGTFTTTLCTGELVKALDAGIVIKIERMAVYEQAPIFVDYVDFFYSMRKKYQREGNGSYDSICKLFLNSLYGKWGERHFEWEPCEGRLPQAGTETTINTHTGEVCVYRQIGDLCEQRSKEKVEGFSSFPAIAAHATSYARLTICGYRELAGLGEVYYTDTDSLIVTDTGLERLQSAGTIGEQLGQLKLEESSSTVTITAPKNYRCGTKVRHKGRRKDAEALGDGKYRQIQFRGLAGAFRAQDVNHAEIRLVVKQADTPYAKGVVDPVSGWTQPFHLQL